MKLFEPESDLSLNIACVAGDIINTLKKEKKPISIIKLLKDFLKRDVRRTHNLFFDALTFLFILDIIKVNDLMVELKKHGKIQKTLF